MDCTNVATGPELGNTRVAKDFREEGGIKNVNSSRKCRITR
jgi:hypothetical protein